MCAFGRPIKDFLQVLPGTYYPQPVWQETLSNSEEVLRMLHLRTMERWSEHTRPIPVLAVGDHVHIQNQIGRNPRKWEVRQYNQYIVRIDGSHRLSIWNRKFLRKYIPIHSPQQGFDLRQGPRIPPFNNPAQPHTTTPCATAVIPIQPVEARTCEPEPSRSLFYMHDGQSAPYDCIKDTMLQLY